MAKLLKGALQLGSPELEPSTFRNESDVEQKFVLPLLVNPSYLGLPSEWIRTKEYMRPTEIDKSAGKRFGYIPDYSIWQRGIPLLIIEVKGPDVALSVGLREARMYASEINKRYPPKLNPIELVIATNGIEIGVSYADSEIDAIVFDVQDINIGSNALAVLQSSINRNDLDRRASDLSTKLLSRRFHSVSGFMGGRNALNELLGVNEFAYALFPTISKYFGADSDETPDDVIEKAYVSTEEITNYEGVLSTYLKDRTRKVAGNTVEQIDTTRVSASGISNEISRFSKTPSSLSRVQLVIGAVGAGKSTFIRRYYKYLLPTETKSKTVWAFINFNVTPPPGSSLRDWLCEQFLESFSTTNEIDIYSEEYQERIFSVEISRFERGPAKTLKVENPPKYSSRRFDMLADLAANPEQFAQCVARHFSSERGLGLVCVFDNVDKRSRDQQLEIFEAAQWFKELTRGLILVNLRDATFEAHKDEKPLDAFSNAINFYIRPPRFSAVIRKRMQLILDQMSNDFGKTHQITLDNGFTLNYPANRVGEFITAVYSAIFLRKDRHITHILEGLVAKDVRRALGMFADILVSPHVPTNDLTGIALASGRAGLKEFVLLKSLMRGRYKYYNGSSGYVKNILHVAHTATRPSNFLIPDILEFLIKNRKERVDFVQEGYVLVATLVKRMSQIGYDELDSFAAIETLVEWGLIEPDSLLRESLVMSDAVRVHAAGFVHMRFLLPKFEYLAGITPDLAVSSRELAEKIGWTWSNRSHAPDLPLLAKRQIVAELSTYFKMEYERRCNRHPFYSELGYGGRAVMDACEATAVFLSKLDALPHPGQGLL
ncbi:type I restriction enzyme HsdR N-terminal domain-containing protein [Sphingomonas aquatica]|uniref:type I restriction enzyme HsdR N-terminal domain-containing protein n=1 Tax=Sphingomonas aquatica TaxID=1763824 RepID=UPI00301D8057